MYKKFAKLLTYQFCISVEESSGIFQIICNDMGHSNYYKKYTATLENLEEIIIDAQNGAEKFAEDNYYTSDADRILKTLGFSK